MVYVYVDSITGEAYGINETDKSIFRADAYRLSREGGGGAKRIHRQQLARGGGQSPALVP